MRALLLAAALTLAPALAGAETYEVLSWNPERLAVVDKDSLSETAGLKRVRITVIFAQARGEGAATQRGMVGLQEFDCAGGRYRTLENAPFDDAGAPLTGLATREPSAWTTIAPGSLGADEQGRVCGGQWTAGAYATKLPVLIAAYLLKPSASGVQTAAAPQASSAQAAATDVVAITPQ